MIALLLCLVAFVVCYLAGRRSLGQGLVALLFFGFFYGILRANLLTMFSHFIFDAGLFGLYLSPRWRDVDGPTNKRSKTVQLWMLLLIAWPMLLVVLPFQPLLVTLVGLRGNIYFLPLLLFGARLKGKDLTELSVGLAVLDLVAAVFATAEYFLGVPRFFPLSPVTQIIYSSADAGEGFLRIPSIFSSAHAFGGTMVATLPYLIGLWSAAEKKLHRTLAVIAVPGTLIGILMSSTRLNFVLGSAMVLAVVFTTPMKAKYKVLFVLILAGVSVGAVSNVRFQRFKSLGDTDAVSERIAGSVNRTFWEILAEYPMGNGLGGGGTSIPYFLAGEVRNPIGMENEYARILCEEGVIGLLLWLSFIACFLMRGRSVFAKGPWSTSRRLVWCLAAIDVGTAWIGIGMLTAIPGTVLLLLGMGWVLAAPQPEAPVRKRQSVVPVRGLRPTYVSALR